MVTFYLDLLTVFKTNGINTLNHARVTDDAAKQAKKITTAKHRAILMQKGIRNVERKPVIKKATISKQQ